MTDPTRISDLRRRIQEDPASIVFAELAEECRRGGSNDEAVAICRAGLAHHPDHLDGRVTLGRSLIELGRLDDAFAELTHVLDAAPGNLPAIRALAELYQRRGMMSEALVHYKRAVQLTQTEVDGSTSGERTLRPADATNNPAHSVPKAPAIEALFDFDTLLAQLDTTREILSTPTFVPLKLPAPTPLDTAVPPPHDAFAEMERRLREREAQRAAEEKQARQAEIDERRRVVLEELEGWLAAIERNRLSRPNA
jgi:tetratricopeptide (TPR) repeat protein